jgi:excisionase family DNA binding protein
MPIATVKDVQDLPAVLKMAQLQQLLGISRPKAYDLAKRRGFPVVRFGRALRVPRDALMRWLDEQTVSVG